MSQKKKALGSSNKIQIIGDIDAEMVRYVADCLEVSMPGKLLITLSSDGGSHYDSLAIVDMLQGRETIIQVYGYCMSAAVLILASGAQRYMSPNSWLMVHEDCGKLTGDTSKLHIKASQMLREEHQWCRLMQDFTGAQWEQMSHDETYLSAQECLELKLIDYIGVYNG